MSAALAYEAAPPRPGSYIPPEQRDVDDASLEYLPDDHPMKQRFQQQQRQRQGQTPELGPNQERAPELAAWRSPSSPGRDQVEDSSAIGEVNRGLSTSIAAPRLPENPHVISRGAYDLSRDETAEIDGEHRPGSVSPSSSSTSSSSTRPDEDGEEPRRGGPDGRNNDNDHDSTQTLFSRTRARGADADLGEDGDGREGVDRRARRPPPLTVSQEMELEARKLEYFFGTPEYPKMLAAFRIKYEKELSGEEGGGEGGNRHTTRDKREYSAEEAEQGLQSQPIDFHRGSKKLQMQLNEGPRAFDPITVLQKQGMMRFQGYAFPPSTELGKLKMGRAGAAEGEQQSVEAMWEKMDQEVRQGGGGGHSPSAVVRRAFYRLVGKDDPREQHLVRAPSDAATPREDTSLIFRVTGLDVIQRRQMRYMLTDFDYGDRQTAFHVMMTYPYTDWIHAFYMVSVGIMLYYLQIHFNAYDFYDEYLGLDLRQAPSAKKPFIAGITTLVMVFMLFQPLLVASIATTRAYRIIMRRPIGPP